MWRRFHGWQKHMAPALFTSLIQPQLSRERSAVLWFSHFTDLYPYDIPENFGFPHYFANRAILRQCLSSVDGIACVSGGTSKTAIMSKVKLVRKTSNGATEIPISLSAMEKGKKSDMAMQANNVLFVPFSYMKNIAFNSTQIVA